MARKAKHKRRVVVTWEYLDGIQGMNVRKPTEFDEKFSVIDIALLDEYDAAIANLQAVEARVMEAAKVEHKNPAYEPFEDANA